MHFLLRGKSEFYILLFNAALMSRIFLPAIKKIFSANRPLVRLQKLTNANISGTSIKTPVTVANTAPDDKPIALLP
jgi:hypothetical protein